MKKIIFLTTSVLFISSAVFAKIKTETVKYSSGSTQMEGFVAYDDAKKGPRPAIIIVHDWMGPGDYTRGKAEALAKEGYVGFAVDMYGVGVRPKDADEAAKISSQVKSDRPMMQARMRAAFDKVVAMKEVNPKKVIVMGYCFGGTSALELARSGAPIAGVATFHGGLSNPNPADAKNIHGKVLVMHGADDPYVNKKEVDAFKDEMNKAHIKFDFISYPGAVHSFTIPTAGNDNSKGAAYNAAADKKSWGDFHKFLKTTL